MTEVTQKQQFENKIDLYHNKLSEMTDAQKYLDKACLAQILFDHRDKKDIDIMAFLRKAQLVGADPRLNEIYLIGYGGRTSVIYNYQFIMNKAAKYADIKAIQCICEKESVYDPIEKEDIVDLVATAKTIIDGIEYVAKAEFNEFYNSRNPTWKSYTKSMLEKCAIVKLCRRIPNTGISDMQIAEENPIYIQENDKEDKDKANLLTEKFSN